MKITSNYNQPQGSAINKKPAFGRYFDAELMKQFEKALVEYKKVNPYLTGNDVATMRKSISSFNAYYKGASTVNASNVENQIYRNLGIPADFQGDNFLASATALSLNIFKKLRMTLPTAIYKRPLHPQVRASCNTMDRSVTFNSHFDWSDSQVEMINEKLVNGSSSGHFLRTPIHEFMHSVHLENLHKLAGQKQQAINNLNSKMLRDFLKIDFKTKMIVEGGSTLVDSHAVQQTYQKVSSYGATKPVEMFADIGAKMITENLNHNTILPQRNPFVFKDFTEDKFLMQMMNDFWQGNFSKYI